MKGKEADSLNKITNQVNHTLDLSEVLAGKKPVGGRIGDKLKRQKEDESNLKEGQKLRDKKFKQFDAYCNRLENVVNGFEEETKDKKHTIKIRRVSLVHPKQPNKVI